MTGRINIHRNASLNQRNTFRVAATAAWLIEVTETSALPDALALPQCQDCPPLVLGAGSNLLFAADPDSAVIALHTHAIAITENTDEYAIVRADAGVAWHRLVQWTLDHGLNGLENLALIPGTVGAAPVQNIGAYGAEVGEFIHAVEAFDIGARHIQRFRRSECDFSYRESRFKRELGRYLIVAVEFRLTRRPVLRLQYSGIVEELMAMSIGDPDARAVAEAVSRIRRRKLPDPERIGNAGSFFKNPTVSADQADLLREDFPNLPLFPHTHGYKLSAAWLIDACGWKGYQAGDAGIAATHALVLVNHGQASGKALLALARQVAGSVQARFRVSLEPEPRLIGAQW